MAEISDDVTIIAREALSKLIRLRQLAIGLGFFDPENTTSAKVDADLTHNLDLCDNYPNSSLLQL